MKNSVIKSIVRTFRLAREEHGNTTILFALSIVPIMVAVGAGIDMVRANRAQAILQGAVDAAALSAAAAERAPLDSGAIANGFYKKEVSKVVDDFITANDVNNALDSIDKVETKINTKTGTLRVRLHGKMKTSLMKVVGIGTVDIEAVAEVGLSSGALEVALVLDNTGSMKGKKIEDLKGAAKGLVATLHEKSGGKTYLKIGVVPYSEYVNVGLDPPGGGWLEEKPVPEGSNWSGCVGSRQAAYATNIEIKGSEKYPAVGNVNCVAELLPLTDDRDTVDAKINSMSARGYTYIPGGLHWGWHILTHNAPYTEGLKPEDLEKIGGSKAMVLMTDGANTISANGALHDSYDSAPADKLTLELCGKIKGDGIALFTVGFQVDKPEIKDILKTCATSPEMAFDAESAAELSAAFSSIGSKLAGLYLSK